MTAKCIGCGLVWRVSPYHNMPKEGYICPRCDSRLKAGESLDYCKTTGRQIKKKERWDKRKCQKENTHC